MATTVLQYDNSGFQRAMGLYESMLKDIAATQRQAMADRANIESQGLAGKAQILAQGRNVPAEYVESVNTAKYPYGVGVSSYMDENGVLRYGQSPYAVPYVDPRWTRGYAPANAAPQAVNAAPPGRFDPNNPSGGLIVQPQVGPVPTEEMKKLYPSIFK